MACSRVNFTFSFTLLQGSFDSPTPDFSRFRSYTLGSRSFLCWVRNSAEVRISGCTRVLRTLLYYLSALFFVYSGVLLCDLSTYFNPLTPNDPYSGRTAPLTTKHCTLYIYSTNIGTAYFKHGIYSSFFFSSKCCLFHNSNVFGSCIIHILYTGCAKI